MPTRRVHPKSALAAAALALVLIAAGCSDDDPPPATNSSSTTETQAAPTSSSVAADADADADADDKDPDAEPVDESALDAWARSAAEHRDRLGDTVQYQCPPGGTAHTVWGTNVYTDDSSVCTAAVHIGLITFEEGGEVEILVEPGLDEYLATANNDVVSHGNGPRPASFSFPASGGVSEFGSIPWERKANFYAASDEEFLTVMCGSNGLEHGIWGTNVYTDDSSICTAAVHAGLITFDDGGEVTFLFSSGRDSYEGSEANGVTSSQYGESQRSFLFVE